jgi:FkbM family methyltransferase
MWVARVLSSKPVGWAVGTALRHRIPSCGLVFDTRDPAITHQVEAQLFFGIYESAEIRLVQRHIHGARVVLDLGSSLGIVSSHILAEMPEDGHLICVEANPHLLMYLDKNTRDHARGQSIDIVHGAISSGGGPTLLQVNDASVTSHLASPDDQRGAQVPSLTLADLLERFDINEPFVVVSDIEGAEVDMILGGQEALRGCSLLIAELHSIVRDGEAVTVRQVHEQILRRGFRVLDQSGPVFAYSH